jgi:putative hemolysin
MTSEPDSRQPKGSTEFASRELGAAYPSFPELLPEGEIRAGRYAVRFARTVEDLDQIERLRFEVFNLELGEGLDSAFATGRDHDDLDVHFHHLLIACTATGEVVGTYRLQTAEMAARHQGFYSAGEFELAELPREFLADAIEVGRACVARDHRNGRVLNLLWRGLARYMVQNRKRYLFGCCSLTSQDAALGQATMAFLRANGHVHPALRTPPLAGLGCEEADPAAVAMARVHIPPLFQSYLNLGAKVLGPPAIDREFKTIDFLVALDVSELDEHSYRFFFR